ncbi:MAG: 30S ribosomal protein S3 [bacterium]|nr:30S ribosomal protein S3 [bacterium]
MGQKVNPLSFRLPIEKKWASKWFAKRDFAVFLVEDIKIRNFIYKKLGTNSAVERVEIARNRDNITVRVYSARPGVIIGRSGQGINALKDAIEKEIFHNHPKQKIKLEIIEIKNPELSAALVAQNVGSQISRRVAYRRAVKQALEKTMTKGAKGIKIRVGGRLNGAEIARNEKFSAGTVPLGNLRADIDYSIFHAITTYGVIGVKVWIYKGLRQDEEE